jgi:DNA polymerase III gamma/tau subunit
MNVSQLSGVTHLLQSSRAFMSARFTHATMFVGDDSVAVLGLMQLYAARVLCKASNKPCLECVDCKLILGDSDNSNKSLSASKSTKDTKASDKASDKDGGEQLNNHADVVVLNSDKVKVEDIQGILDTVHISPFGSHKLYLITNFDRATPQAQNKLLKCIEEPPSNVIFVLGASNRANVLTTILSRCQVVDVPPFAVDELRAVLSEQYPPEDLDFALSLANGNLTLTERYLSDKKSKDNFARATQILLNLRGSIDIPRVSKMLSDSKDSLKDVVGYMSLLLRDAIALKLAVRNLWVLVLIREICLIYPSYIRQMH